MALFNKSSKTNKGEALVWFSSLGLTIGLLMIIGILSLITFEGVSIFWPKNIELIKLKKNSAFKVNNKSLFAGEIILERNKTVNKISFKKIDGKRTMINTPSTTHETQFYVANRDIYGFSFHYVNTEDILKRSKPQNLMMIDRNNDSRAIIIPQALLIDNKTSLANEEGFIKKLNKALDKAKKLNKKIHTIADTKLRKINATIKNLFIKAYVQTKEAKKRKKEKTLLTQYLKLEASLVTRFPNLDKTITKKEKLSPSGFKSIKEFIIIRQKLNSTEIPIICNLIKTHKNIYKENEKSQKYLQEISKLKQVVNKDKLIAKDPTDKDIKLNIAHIASYYSPNKLSVFGKTRIFFRNIFTFLFDNPREANTQGGVFPAIIGTFVMTILMSVAVTPLGIIAAIYLKEYAKQGKLTRVIRITINNLAGIPSIVFGAFGLGFFVYGLGYNIDKLFFNDHIESGAGAVFGTGGLLWSSLTLALMTLPVVIVASEEALSSVSKGMREGAFGCGASKWQSIQTIVIPAAMPGIITGIILAMARGAGEVAPLMLVGVVKIAPSLPIDSIYPYIHLDYKFMHLGFHIYDLGFQSPDSEAAKPMVFATTLLLISIVCALNLIGILVRQHLRKKYATGTF